MPVPLIPARNRSNGVQSPRFIELNSLTAELSPKPSGMSKKRPITPRNSGLVPIVDPTRLLHFEHLWSNAQIQIHGSQ